MDTFRRLERENAHDWDDRSEISSTAPSATAEVPSTDLAAYFESEEYCNSLEPVPSAEYGNGRFYQGSRPLPTDGSPERKQGEKKTQANRAAQPPIDHEQPKVTTAKFVRALYGGRGGRYPTSPARGNLQARYNPNQQQRPQIKASSPGAHRGRGRGQGRGQGRGRGRGGQQEHRPLPPPPVRWAEPPPLMTTRKAEEIEDQRMKDAEGRQYKQMPNHIEDFPSVAYYLWPSNKDSQGPHDILGRSLEALDKIRVDHKVFVGTSHSGTCLKLCSRIPNDDSRLHAAMNAIRKVIRHQHAIYFAAQPKNIVVPPALAAIVLPIKKVKLQDKVYETTGTKLGAENLSQAERLQWAGEYPTHWHTFLEKFEQTLIEALKGLQTYRSWMRMRVRFGHVILHGAMGKFANGKQYWKELIKMIDVLELKSTFDARFNDPKVVGFLRAIITERPEQFQPASGIDRSLELVYVPFRFTEVVFLDTPAYNLRVEAEIDVLSEKTEEGEYQVGATRYFNDGERNKRMQLTVMDAEHEFDWSMDIVTDDEIDVKNIAVSVQKIVQGSVTPRSQIRQDAFGLPYPDVKPLLCPGVTIKGVVVKSVVEYKLGDTGYVVELTLFRTWEGSDTRVEPVLSAAVSVYHQDWEWKMAQLPPTAGDRIWARPLKTFFGEGVQDDDTDTGTGGVEKFIAAVKQIQGFLDDASRKITLQDQPEVLKR